MEKVSCLATALTPPHVLGYSTPSPLTPSLQRTAEVASPNGNFQLKQEELGLNTLHPQFPAYIPYLKESEQPEPEINCTPLLLVVPQLFFFFFFFPFFKRCEEGCFSFSRLSSFYLLATDCLGNNKILIQDPLHNPITT